VSGLAGGLLGIGGGGVMVPPLVAVTGLAQRTAHAVSLGAVVPLALSLPADTLRYLFAAFAFTGLTMLFRDAGDHDDDED
jgi:hypothetical protein